MEGKSKAERFNEILFPALISLGALSIPYTAYLNRPDVRKRIEERQTNVVEEVEHILTDVASGYGLVEPRSAVE